MRGRSATARSVRASPPEAAGRTPMRASRTNGTETSATAQTTRTASRRAAFQTTSSTHVALAGPRFGATFTRPRVDEWPPSGTAAVGHRRQGGGRDEIGAREVGADTVLLQGNVVAWGEANVEATSVTHLTVLGNFFLNPQNTGSRGQNVQVSGRVEPDRRRGQLRAVDERSEIRRPREAGGLDQLRLHLDSLSRGFAPNPQSRSRGFA